MISCIIKFDNILELGTFTGYSALCLAKGLKPTGKLITIDVLWYGKVNEQIPENDTYTKGLIEFNTFVQNDSRVENVIFPVRDGLMVVRKK